MYIVALLTLLWLPQQQEPCSDVASCRSMADAAREAKDYEAFHDLAWAAYREGKANDPELMLLVARAQSLSGRPGDALVMLERIAALGAPTDAATSEDFARVRTLPRWSEVAEKLASPTKAGAAPPPSDPKPEPVTKEPARADTPPTKTPEKSAAKGSEKLPVEKTEKPAEKADKPAEKLAGKPAGETKAKSPFKRTEEEPAPKKDPNAPLGFATILSPDALAYDAVSRRFIIADKKARRVAVIDEHSGQVATLVGAQGALGEISGMAIDPSQGDLWVISTGEDGPSLHRMQLISGRMLSTVPLSIEDGVVSAAWVPGTGLVVGDANGVVWSVGPGGKPQKLGALEYVPRAFAADARGRLYVAGGTKRLARFAVSSTLRRIDTIDVDAPIPAVGAFVVSGNRLHLVVPLRGSFQIRSVPVK